MDQAVSRYGPVVRHDTIQGEELYLFTKDRFVIMAHFYDGKIDSIYYSKESREKLDKEEVDTFLKANNGGRMMEELAPNTWTTKNDTSASLNKLGGFWHLDIKSIEYQQRSWDAYAAEEKAAADAEKARKEKHKANLKTF